MGDRVFDYTTNKNWVKAKGDSNGVQEVNANITSGSEVVISDGSNTIGSSQDADGNYHLNTAFIQSILSSTNNSTTDNLASGATFTGSAEETFGICAIQVYHYADQDCTITIEQSLDATNWDVSDSFECVD